MELLLDFWILECNIRGATLQMLQNWKSAFNGSKGQIWIAYDRDGLVTLDGFRDHLHMYN